ncbi:GNAT family N-acetyltransferase [Desulfospira joergensenii]|uniref:GNAT family N-acetyltransferase n=1 Tax=Desulfospira joergensenii TaxID=53329 RepID=UPI0003B595DA|nr:GNAT family N-acetyltransferase [Desulfospira joergensenii]
MRVKIHTHSREWDRFVREDPGAAYGHLFGWRRVIEAAYGHKPLYLAAAEDRGSEKIRAVLPLFRFKRPFCRPEWISIPFFDQAGILARDEEAGRFLLEKAGAILAGKGEGRLSLRQDRGFDASALAMDGRRPEIFRGKIGLSIRLGPGPQKMEALFRSKLRSQVRKGLKNGLTWDIGKHRLLNPFYRVLSRNMRDLGSPVHSKKFFKGVLACFPGQAFICVVYFKGMPVAASFMFRFKNRIANPWASSVREFRHLNANMVLYWQMIRFACNLGLDVFDMGRSSRGASTHRFKEQWGPEETPLSWYTWTLGREKSIRETLSISPWKTLPLWGANLAGPVVRKYISL